MKVLLSKVLSPLFLALCLAGCISAQNAGPEAVVDKFVKAWNTHDMKAFDRLFIDDAVWVTRAEIRIEGRTNIIKDFTEAHTTWASGSSIEQSDREVRVLGKDAAAIFFRAGFLDEGKLVPDSKRALLIVVVRKKGVWKIAVGQLDHPSPKT